MEILLDAQEKLFATINVIQELEGIDYPHPDARYALKLVKGVLEGLLQQLGELDSDASPSVIQSHCVQATSDISDVLELTGFVVNSSNVRNAFEIHQPILNIAKKLIRSDAQLLLSFEWNYIPFTLPLTVPSLPNFVIIGLPASEANNPLVIPAIGHELGHSVWRNESVEAKLGQEIRQQILFVIINNHWGEFLKHNNDLISNQQDLYDLIGTQLWGRAYRWARGQIEELFCDSIGLILFGSGYLHAFSYLIAPKIGDLRSERYPNFSARAAFLDRFARKIGVKPIDDFVQRFQDQSQPYEAGQYSHLLLRIADSSVQLLEERVFELASQICASKGFAPPQEVEWEPIVTAFKAHVPAAKVGSLASIVNAGWVFYRDTDLLAEHFGDGPHATKSLNELILKSIEVLEIEGLIQGVEIDTQAEPDSGSAEG